LKWIRATSLIISSVAMLCSCAKVGDPLPPIKTLPYEIENVRIIQSGDELLFLFAEPSMEVDRVELLRQCEANPGIESIQTTTITDIPTLEGIDDRILTSSLSDQDRGCRFAIRLLDRENRATDYSSWLRTREIIPPPPPVDLSYEVTQDRIFIRWASPSPASPQANGYLINYRHQVKETEFVDRDFEFGKPAQYWVQTIGRPSSPMVLSSKSRILSFTPTDTFPPQSPANLRGVPLEESIQLIWDANSSADLAGYRVYRGREPNRLSILADGIDINRFLDESLPVGTMFYYEVTAIDSSGNESNRSETLSISIDK
jgi:hypothetical protein